MALPDTREASSDSGRRPRGDVRLTGVTKRFGDVVAVDALDLEVHDREFLVLLGPSGCGKSTVLRLVAGLEEASEGTIEIGGEAVEGFEAKDRDVAMVFQSYALYPHMTVRRNIEFPLAARHVPKPERDAAVREAARALDLGPLLDRKPAALSGGQRQRVALARAIVRQPLVFLMDEPLSNLDAKLRVQTRAELIELHRRLATTVIYVTHDQVEAMTMGDRIAVLTDGALQQVGPPQEVYDRPANLFVARFIGSPPMNTVAGRVVDEGEGLAVAVGSATLPLPAATSAAVAASGAAEVVLGVRPEALTIDGGVLPATVTLVESLGHERLVVCGLETGDLVIVRTPGSGEPFRSGDAVKLSAPTAALHVFDAATGDRIDG
ncbi:MAG TPA: ABC transporter ATP-binding protein [Acidimicrobiales bacterium]|nr:ABC transporter ATP-binding protein [Acidimicrobiales bacterium]